METLPRPYQGLSVIGYNSDYQGPHLPMGSNPYLLGSNQMSPATGPMSHYAGIKNMPVMEVGLVEPLPE